MNRSRSLAAQARLGRLLPRRRLAALDAKAFVKDLGALTLVIAAAFVSYLRYYDFDLGEPSAHLALGGLLLLSLPFALVCAALPAARPLVYGLAFLVFLDLQFDWLDDNGPRVLVAFCAASAASWLLRRHISTIVLAAFGVATLTGLAGPAERAAAQRDGAGVAAAGEDLPPYIHLILDEHAGIGGLPADVAGGMAARAEAEGFLRRYGFRWFPNAYSHYFDTDISVSSALRFAAMEAKPEGEPRVWEAPYLAGLARRGYRLRIYHPGHPPLCRQDDGFADFCHLYRQNDVASVAHAALPEWAKAVVLLRHFSTLSDLKRRFKAAYNEAAMRLSRDGAGPSRLEMEAERVSALSALRVLEQVVQDAVEAPPGTAIVAHLLLPHFPYSLDRTCAVRRPVWRWKANGYDWSRPDALNDARSRSERYGLYFDQVACVRSKLQELLSGLARAGKLAAATVVVHGDHGSRIALRLPTAETVQDATPADFADAYSALFAVRMPGLAPGPDARALPIEELLRRAAEAPGLLSAPAPGDDGHRPYVLLEREGEEGLVRAPMPPLRAPAADP